MKFESQVNACLAIPFAKTCADSISQPHVPKRQSFKTLVLDTGSHSSAAAGGGTWQVDTWQMATATTALIGSVCCNFGYHRSMPWSQSHAFSLPPSKKTCLSTVTWFIVCLSVCLFKTSAPLIAELLIAFIIQASNESDSSLGILYSSRLLPISKGNASLVTCQMSRVTCQMSRVTSGAK